MDPKPAENDTSPSSFPSHRVTDPFSRMRVRYMFGWLISAFIVIPTFSSLIEILGLGRCLESSWRELLSRGIPHCVILLAVWIYLRHNRVSWTQLLGPSPRQRTWFRALKLVPLLIVFSLAELFLVAYSLSHLAPHVLDKLLSIELFVSAANEQHQWFYNLVVIFEVVVLGPVVEEALFRGLLLHRWAVKWNLTAALWTSSLLFGIGHGPSVIGGTVFGLVMAILYIETGSLLVPVVAHATNNASACVVRALDELLPSWALPDFWSSAADIGNTPWLGVLFLALSSPPMFFYLSKHWPGKSVTLPYFRVTALSAPAGTSRAGPSC